MPKSDKYVPKHRSAPRSSAPTTGLRKSVVYSSLAVAATGVSVTGGVLANDTVPAGAAAMSVSQPATDGATEAASASAAALAERSERSERTSRADRRTTLDSTKARTLRAESGGQVTRTADLSEADPKTVAQAMMGEYGFASSEWSCLDQLWISESDWEVDADNPTSSAYGIPQALTGGTHDNLPADYMTNAESQIRWGLEYIKDSYGTPCSAWSFKQGNNWY